PVILKGDSGILHEQRPLDPEWLLAGLSSWAHHPFLCRSDDLNVGPSAPQVTKCLPPVLPHPYDQESVGIPIRTPFLTTCTQSWIGHPCFHFDVTSLRKLGIAQASISLTLPVQTKISALPPATQNSWCQ